MKDVNNHGSESRNFQDKSLELPLAFECLQPFLEVFPEEKHLLLHHNEKRRVEREHRVRRIADFLEIGAHTLSFDLGCKVGQMSSSLQTATGGHVVGIDCDSTSVGKAQRIGNGSIDYILADFAEWEIPNELLGRFDQVVASNFLHEVYSTYGETGLARVIGKANLLLKKGGRLIVMDGIHPTDGNTSVEFKDGQTREQFNRFVDLYKAKTISYTCEGNGTIIVKNADFTRFLNSLKFVIPDDLQGYESTLKHIKGREERVARAFYILDYYTLPLSTYSAEFMQDFTFYSRDQWVEGLQSSGFSIEATRLYNERRVEEFFWRSGIELSDRRVPQIYIMIVGRKDTKCQKED